MLEGTGPIQGGLAVKAKSMLEYTGCIQGGLADNAKSTLEMQCTGYTKGRRRN